MPTEKINTNSNSIDFMLEEFRYLKSSYEGAMAWRDERFKNFINIVFSSVALLAIIAQFSKSSTTWNYSLIILSLILYLYGLFVFSRLVAGFLSIEHIRHAINRVRGYFVDLDNNLRDYLVLPLDTSKPLLVKTKLGSGLLGITALTNSILAAVFGTSLFMEVVKWDILPSAGFGLFVAFLSWIFHALYFYRQAKKDGQKDARKENHE
jgi:hypothetical protein